MKLTAIRHSLAVSLDLDSAEYDAAREELMLTEELITHLEDFPLKACGRCAADLLATLSAIRALGGEGS